MMPAVILAGGKGTRLGALTRQRPKALVPIVGKPFLYHQLDLLAAHGVTDAIVCVAHLADQIELAIRDYRGPVRVEALRDGADPAGTGGAARKAADLVGGPCAVIYGDSYLRCPIQAILERFAASRDVALMTVIDAERVDEPANTTVRGGRVIRYRKGGGDLNLTHVDYGLLAFRPAAFAGVEAESFDLSEPLAKVAENGNLTAVTAQEPYLEMGSPQGLQRLSSYLQTANTTGVIG